jgi:hypothetical protein
VCVSMDGSRAGRQAGGTAWREVVLSFSRRWRVPVCDACDRDLDQHEGRRHDRLQTERCQKKNDNIRNDPMDIEVEDRAHTPTSHVWHVLYCTVL